MPGFRGQSGSYRRSTRQHDRARKLHLLKIQPRVNWSSTRVCDHIDLFFFSDQATNTLIPLI